MDEQPVQQGDARAGYRGSDASTTSTSGRAPPSCSARPLSSWRRAMARKRRTKVDWAEEVASLRPLRELRAPSCATTSTPTRRERSAKRPARARELVKRIEFCYTPKHGSWLNIAENELRIRQCLRHRRLGDLETLQTEISAWSRRRQRAAARRGLGNES